MSFGRVSGGVGNILMLSSDTLGCVLALAGIRGLWCFETASSSAREKAFLCKVALDLTTLWPRCFRVSELSRTTRSAMRELRPIVGARVACDDDDDGSSGGFWVLLSGPLWHKNHGDDSRVVASLFAAAPELKIACFRSLGGDVASLSNLVKLEKLDLYQCEHLSGNVACLSSLVNLKVLDLYGCSRLAGDVASFSKLVLLESLRLDLCYQLTGDVDSLSGLVRLKLLRISGSFQTSMRLTGDISGLTTLTNLETLDLSACAALSGEITAPAVRWLSGIREKSLYRCGHLTLATDLTAIYDLTHVDLSTMDSLVGDVESFSGLVNLARLDLSDCRRLRGASGWSLKGMFPGCEIQCAC